MRRSNTQDSALENFLDQDDEDGPVMKGGMLVDPAAQHDNGAGTSIEGCDAQCTSPDDFCWLNLTQKSCGKHYFRQFCTKLGNTCEDQFGETVPLCASGSPYSIDPANCTDANNQTGCPACCIEQTGFSIDTELLGWLQFAFLFGYMPAMLIFGHLVRTVKPFKLMGTGLTIWCCAVLFSGFAGPHFFDSYVLMLAARAVSGVGEASFQCIGPPFIDDYAPKPQKGVWLAIFYSAIPVGTALGFVYAGQIAAALSWEYAFIIECPIMLPIAIGCFFIPLELKNDGDLDTGDGDECHHGDGDDHSLDSDGTPLGTEEPIKSPGFAPIHSESEGLHGDEAEYDPYGGVSGGGSSDNDSDNDLSEQLVDNIYSSTQKGQRIRGRGSGEAEASTKVTLWEQLRPVVTVPTFLLVTFGYAGYSAVTAGFAFYGPLYVQENFCQFTQGTADLVFGGVIVVAGMVGTPLGGFVFDLKCGKKEEARKRLSQDAQVSKALWHMTAQVALGTALCFGAVYVAGAIPFFALLAAGCVFIFMTTSAVNIATMWTVPPQNRPFAIAVSTILIHLFGDVPSPVIIGLLDDDFTPTFTLLCTVLWLLWSVVLWFGAWAVWKAHLAHKKSSVT